MKGQKILHQKILSQYENDSEDDTPVNTHKEGRYVRYPQVLLHVNIF